jgi:hypothetical protein
MISIDTELHETPTESNENRAIVCKIFGKRVWITYNYLMRFQVLTAVSMKMAVLWVVVQCLVAVYRRCLPSIIRAIALMVEAVSTSETSANCYQII